MFPQQIMFSFQIELLDRRTCRRHIDHLCTRFDSEENTTRYEADIRLIDNATETNLTTDPEVTKSISTPNPTSSLSTSISESTYDFESNRSKTKLPQPPPLSQHLLRNVIQKDRLSLLNVWNLLIPGRENVKTL